MTILPHVRGTNDKINGFWIKWMDLLVFLYSYTQFWQLTITDFLPLAPFLAWPWASSLLLWRTKNSCSHLELPWTMYVSRKHTNSLLTSPLNSELTAHSQLQLLGGHDSRHHLKGFYFAVWDHTVSETTVIRVVTISAAIYLITA
jgi:hypothetical protein